MFAGQFNGTEVLEQKYNEPGDLTWMGAMEAVVST